MRNVILITILALALMLAACGSEYIPTPDPLDAVRVESTRQAMALEATRTALDLQQKAFDLERERARAESVDAFLMALPWVFLLVGLGACAIVAYWFLPILAQKVGLVTRKAEDGETILLLGKDRLALPLRSAGVYLDLLRGKENAPLLAADAATQERATLRQQTANAMLAQQAAQTVKARTQREGDVTMLLPRQDNPTSTAAAPSPVRVLEEPTETVRGWLGDVQTALLPEVVNDGD